MQRGEIWLILERVREGDGIFPAFPADMTGISATESARELVQNYNLLTCY